IVVRNDITYVTGGVGDEEMEMLREVGSDFNVQLMLAASGGAYISNAFIRILDSAGTELMSAKDAGPYLYVSLPPGKYTFDVTAPQGGIKNATITAPARGIT